MCSAECTFQRWAPGVARFVRASLAVSSYWPGDGRNCPAGRYKKSVIRPDISLYEAALYGDLQRQLQELVQQQNDGHERENEQGKDGHSYAECRAQALVTPVALCMCVGHGESSPNRPRGDLRSQIRIPPSGRRFYPGTVGDGHRELFTTALGRNLRVLDHN
jgi:hypothetical protein